jgi:hypothetical protein
MTLEAIGTIALAVLSFATLNFAALQWLLDRRARKEHASAERVDDIDRRVTELEGAHKSLPGWNTVAPLRQQIADLSGKVGIVSANIDEVRREQGNQRESIKRIEDHLLESPR